MGKKNGGTNERIQKQLYEAVIYGLGLTKLPEGETKRARANAHAAAAERFSIDGRLRTLHMYVSEHRRYRFSP